jgi:hypothetical protein
LLFFETPLMDEYFDQECLQDQGGLEDAVQLTWAYFALLAGKVAMLFHPVALSLAKRFHIIGIDSIRRLAFGIAHKMGIAARRASPSRWAGSGKPVATRCLGNTVLQRYGINVSPYSGGLFARLHYC